MKLSLLAAEISNLYKKNPKVEAVLLGGSVSRNWHDEFSDIELSVLWKEDPIDEERKEPIPVLKGTIIEFHPYEEEEWSESYTTQGVKIEISNFLTQTVKNTIYDVVKMFDTNLEKQCLVASIHDGIPLYGKDVVNNLKKTVKVYPKELSEAMIKENIDLGTRWHNREALLAREDWLMLYDVMVSAQVKVMGLLFGINRLYVHHPSFKWQTYSLKQMKHVPYNISNRLSSILLNHPKKGLPELEYLIQEVFYLIQVEYPHLDLSNIIWKTNFLRPKNNLS
ncbi:DUF4037 domain-containing protein [Priestia filamentosa]|uniref:DUF4037 domain-containing protein n=1 Tax=Priestia filamentosa TaxID=1402861 RepID=UPI00397CDD4D